MSVHTDHVQIISRDGKPEYAVIPYGRYLALTQKDTDDLIVPNEVVGYIIKDGMNAIKAWRKYLGLTQAEVAKKAGITQSALSQMESVETTNRTGTIEKIAAAMEIHAALLLDT